MMAEAAANPMKNALLSFKGSRIAAPSNWAMNASKIWTAQSRVSGEMHATVDTWGKTRWTICVRKGGCVEGGGGGGCSVH
jgi:hypothetical protein